MGHREQRFDFFVGICSLGVSAESEAGGLAGRQAGHEQTSIRLEAVPSVYF